VSLHGTLAAQEPLSLTISAPSQALLFVTNPAHKSTDFRMRQHDAATAALLKEVNGSTSRLLATRTNAQIITCIVDKDKWVINVSNLKQRNAMIVFDGHKKPIQVLEPHEYQQYAQPLLAQYANKKLDVDDSGTVFFDSIAHIAFVPSSEYSQKIIQQTTIPIYAGRRTECEGKYSLSIFPGADESQPSSIIQEEYQQGLLRNSNNTSAGNNYYQQYFYNPDRLIDSIQYFQNSRLQYTFYYRYLPNSVIQYSSDYTDANVYLLDHDFRVIESQNRHFVYDRNSRTQYHYNTAGQLIEEQQWDKNQKEDRITYSYTNSDSDDFADRKTYDNNGNLKFELRCYHQNGDQVQEIYVEGALQSRSILTVSEDCEMQSSTYDKTGKLTSKFIRKKNPSY